MISLRYIRPESCELEMRLCNLISGSLGDEGIEDIIVEDPVEF